MSTTILGKPIHPLDPLTSEEIIETSRLVRIRFPGRSLHFKAIAITEPPKKQLVKYLAAECSGYSDLPKLVRRSNALFFPRGTTELYAVDVNLSTSTVEKVEQLGPGFYPQADVDEIIKMRDVCLSHPRVLEAARKFGLPEGTILACDTWPFGRQNDEERRRLVQVRSLSA